MCRFSGVAGQDSYDIVGPNIREMADIARQRHAVAVAQQPEAQPPQIPAPPVAQQEGNRAEVPQPGEPQAEAPRERDANPEAMHGG